MAINGWLYSVHKPRHNCLVDKGFILLYLMTERNYVDTNGKLLISGTFQSAIPVYKLIYRECSTQQCSHNKPKLKCLKNGQSFSKENLKLSNQTPLSNMPLQNSPLFRRKTNILRKCRKNKDVCRAQLSWTGL